MIYPHEMSNSHTENLLLEFSPETLEKAQAEWGKFSNNMSAWNAYRNRLCLDTFLDWLKEVVGETPTAMIQPWPDEANLPSFWEFIEGVALQWGETKILLLPTEVGTNLHWEKAALPEYHPPQDILEKTSQIKSEFADTFSLIEDTVGEFRNNVFALEDMRMGIDYLLDGGGYHQILEPFTVPQEWVDIFPVDYYIAVQVNLGEEPDENYLEVRGYTTHEAIKKQGNYDENQRVYCMNFQDLIPNISLLFMARKFVDSRQVDVNLKCYLAASQVEIWLHELGDSAVENPRLKLPFEAWGALLKNEQWRHQLYQNRLKKKNQKETPPLSVNFKRWLENFAEESWQTIEHILMNVTGTQSANLAYGFRGNGVRDTMPKAVPALIELLKTQRSKETCLPALYLLGQVGQNSTELSDFLTEILQTTVDEDIRRQAAVSLGQIQPNHPQAGIRRVKLINLAMQLQETQVALVVTLMPKLETETNVHVRVYPVNEQLYLPADLKLVILDETGNPFLEVESRPADNWIQLEFTGDLGDQFSVQLTLGEVDFVKNFAL